MDKPNNFRNFVKGLTPKTGDDKDRSKHFAWGGGDVVVKKADPRRKHWGWKEGDIQITKQGDLNEDFTHASHPSLNITHEPESPDHEWDAASLAHQAAHRDTYGKENESAHSLYKVNSEDNFNSDLRKGFNKETGKIGIKTGESIYDTDPDTVRKHIPALDEATSHKTDKPMTMYRGFGYGLDVGSMTPGTEFHDHGYTGLTASKSFAHGYGNTSMHMPGFASTVAKVHVPAGTKGHLLDHPKYASPLRHEREFTLNRGTKFRVTHHTHHTDETGKKYHFVHMDVIGQHAADVHEVKG